MAAIAFLRNVIATIPLKVHIGPTKYGIKFTNNWNIYAFDHILTQRLSWSAVFSLLRQSGAASERCAITSIRNRVPPGTQSPRQEPPRQRLIDFPDDTAGGGLGRGAFRRLRRRLTALANVHSAIFEAGRQDVPLAAVVDLTVLPYRTEAEDRFSVNGPDITTTREAGTTLALYLHELATNAIK
ncbi:MAG TPA: HWE histidine kinase domain-containing protein [Devosia sp.]|nr:HWE histidine kinase domain-containing protein [Devosia sp.]